MHNDVYRLIYTKAKIKLIEMKLETSILIDILPLILCDNIFMTIIHFYSTPRWLIAVCLQVLSLCNCLRTVCGYSKVRGPSLTKDSNSCTRKGSTGDKALNLRRAGIASKFSVLMKNWKEARMCSYLNVFRVSQLRAIRYRDKMLRRDVLYLEKIDRSKTTMV